MAHALADMLSAAWLQAPAAPQGGGVPNWRMLAEGDGAIQTADDTPRTAYERVLLGADSTAFPWSARLELLPGLPPTAGQGPAFLQSLLGQTPASTARISLSLGPTKNLKPQQGQSQTVLKLSADVPLLREPGQWTAPQFSPAGRAQVQAVLALWSQAISAQLACEPVRPEVLPTAGGLLRLNAGSLAGVQPGEEWLLADPTAFPERLLAPGTLQQLVLAKVHQVHAGYAELHVLAGAARPVQAGWRAWRAQSPLGE